MQADYIYNYNDAQDRKYNDLRFVQRASTPGFAIFQEYGSANYVVLHLDRVGLNEHGQQLARAAKVCNPWGDVIAFHKKFNLNYDGPPRLLEPSLEKFRRNFMAEEHKEFNAATDDNQRLDAICDYIYVALGYCHLRGWNFAEAWRRVQEKNMTKRPATAEDVAAGKTRHTSDILKPDGWTPPDHSDLVEVK